MERGKRRDGERKKIIFVAVLVAVGVGVALAAGVGTVLYRRGVRAGRKEIYERSEAAVQEIAKIVQEKDELERALNRLEEAETLGEYREKLGEASEKTTDEATREVIEGLMTEVEEIEKTDGADAVARSYLFGKFREKAKEAEESLGRRFKARLENAVGKLDS